MTDGRTCLPCQRGDCERCMGLGRCTHDCPEPTPEPATETGLVERFDLEGLRAEALRLRDVPRLRQETWPAAAADWMDDAAQRIDFLEGENERQREALRLINAVRSNVIATQNAGWSNLMYPLVAILNDAGCELFEPTEAGQRAHLNAYGSAPPPLIERLRHSLQQNNDEKGV